MLHRVCLCAAMTLCGLMVAQSPATLVTTDIASDAEMLGLIESLSAIAEGRIGDAADPARSDAMTHEINIQNGDHHVVAQDNYTWQNHIAASFVLSFDGVDTVSYTVGNKTLSHQFDPTDFTAMTDLFFIRQRSTTSSGLTISDLVLDGQNITGTLTADGTDTLTITRISGAVLTDGFTLTGMVTMNWDTQTPPNQSQLAYQIKLGNIVPEPTVLMLMLGSAALWTRKRRSA